MHRPASTKPEWRAAGAAAALTRGLDKADSTAKKAAASAKKRSYVQLVKMLDAFIEIEWNQKQGLAKAEDSLMLACQENF